MSNYTIFQPPVPLNDVRKSTVFIHSDSTDDSTEIIFENASGCNWSNEEAIAFLIEGMKKLDHKIEKIKNGSDLIKNRLINN